jgi:SAM-dependent methyltransferase
METFHRHLITHADHAIAAPLAESAVETVLERAMRGIEEPRLLDLGCGEGAWLNRALAARPDATAVGVDIDGPGLARGTAEAERLRVADRLRLVEGDVSGYVPEQPGDVVLSVGATHAFGGMLPALRAAGKLVAPGGTLVFGECFWEREPGPAVLEQLGAERGEYRDLAGTVELIAAEGWQPVYGHTSSLAEWDDYEWNWVGSLTRWALDHPEHPRGAEELAAAQRHRAVWLGGYRGTLGFATLVLRRKPAGHVPPAADRAADPG